MALWMVIHKYDLSAAVANVFRISTWPMKTTLPPTSATRPSRYLILPCPAYMHRKSRIPICRLAIEFFDCTLQNLEFLCPAGLYDAVPIRQFLFSGLCEDRVREPQILGHQSTLWLCFWFFFRWYFQCEQVTPYNSNSCLLETWLEIVSHFLNSFPMVFPMWEIHSLQV